MLSRASAKSSTNSFVSIQQISKRYFDYLSVANRVENGESIETQLKLAETERQQDSKRFSWNFINWYEKYAPQRLAQFNTQRAQFQQFEQYVSGQGAKGGSKVDFSSFRERICDPKFVDELEIDYNVNVAATKSIENMQTLEKWNEKSVNNFKKECESSGDLLWPPMTQNDKNDMQQQIENAESRQIKLNEILNELQKDYEQIDAERMIYGQETTQMKYAEHPQYAETIEDQLAAHQTFGDFLMMPWCNNELRHERLAAMQDENRRKLFLERFERGSAIYNGRNDPEHTGGGH